MKEDDPQTQGLRCRRIAHIDEAHRIVERLQGRYNHGTHIDEVETRRLDRGAFLLLKPSLRRFGPILPSEPRHSGEL